MDVKIGCIALVFYHDRLLGIECIKGRGFIMPGGKWEVGETFRETAARELKEETGLILNTPLVLVHSGMSEEGYYTYSFTGIATADQIARVLDSRTPAGKVRLGSWGELKQSAFRGYYDILEEVMGKQ